MSSYIQIPNSITTKLTKRSKQEEALVYALIRNQIKDNSFKASFPQSKLVDYFVEENRTLTDLEREGRLLLSSASILRRQEYFTQAKRIITIYQS